jgi:DNA uptake protein ComE-like DNA-binding protein
MWKDWLSFSRNEQYGILLLFAIVLALLLLRLGLPLFVGQEVILSMDGYQDAVVIEPDSRPVFEQPSLFADKEKEWSLFNPNDVSVAQLQSMGVPPLVIVNWIKYREAGGRFFTEEEIRKVYGLDSVLAGRLIQYASCKPAIGGIGGEKKSVGNFSLHSTEQWTETEGSFGNKTSTTAVSHESKRQPSFQIGESAAEESAHWAIEVNTTTAEEWMDFRGVGPVLSKRIVAFREALGGFYSVSQVKEVYGVSQELFDEMVTHLFVDETQMEVIDVNRTSLRRLKQHPYIDFYQARDIVEYRKEQGSINSLEELKRIPSFDDNKIDRLGPYLVFHPDSLPTSLVPVE